jgi:hypothetical protein
MKKIFNVLAIFLVLTVSKAEAKKIAPVSTKIVADSIEFVAYFGKYNFKENPIVKSVVVSFQNGVLVATDQDKTEYDLKRDEKNKDFFTIEGIGAEITFVRKGDKITELKLSVQGQDLLAVKELENTKK